MRSYGNFSKVSSVPRRPFEKERIDRELQMCGKYGLRNKREIWRVQKVLGKLRASARFLLTLPESDLRRQLNGAALIRRCQNLGLLTDDRLKLEYILFLKLEDLLARRLQTIVSSGSLARSVHHARCLITQRHVRVGTHIVSVPSFLVRTQSEKHIGFATQSPYGGGAPGRVRRAKATKKPAAAAEEEEEE